MRRRTLLAVSLSAVVACLSTAMPASAATSYDPVNSDCSAGYVTFSFDDGPDVNTPAVMQTLVGLGLKGVFFTLGNKIDGNPAGQQTIRDLAANGFSVQNHSYDHASWTGASTSTAPLTAAEITRELQSASGAVLAAGVPAPTLYRPPYGDINAYDDGVARQGGLRLVMPWGSVNGNIVDSNDWSGISSAQIVANVTQGYTVNGYGYPGIRANSIVTMHDGLGQTTLTMIAALQPIVDYMNSHHLCSTGAVRPDATGGIVPASPPEPPTSGNVVQNPSMEQLRVANTPAAEPICFQQAGASVSGNTAAWSLTNDAHSGSVAENVTVTRWTGGDRKLIMTQRQSEAACLAAVTPGTGYSMWVWYKGDWVYQGAAASKVSLVTYYRAAGGGWVYWQSGPLFPPSASWSLAYFKSAPLPAGATAVSFGLALQGLGTLTTDDYTMAPG